MIGPVTWTDPKLPDFYQKDLFQLMTENRKSGAPLALPNPLTDDAPHSRSRLATVRRIVTDVTNRIQRYVDTEPVMVPSTTQNPAWATRALSSELCAMQVELAKAAQFSVDRANALSVQYAFRDGMHQGATAISELKDSLFDHQTKTVAMLEQQLLNRTTAAEGLQLKVDLLTLWI